MKSTDLKKEKEMDIFAIGDRISLCKSIDDDKAFYLKIQKENTIMSSAYALEGYEDMLWDEMKDEKAFYTAIRRTDNTYMGYCGIKNIYKNEMELVIEILKEYHNQGYGSEALKLYMEQVSTLAGIRSFKALVDGENIASQTMCEKIGGVPSGIAEHLLHNQKYMEEYEKENQDEVTDQLRVVAKKFGIQPEKLLTHVLVYRFEL